MVNEKHAAFLQKAADLEKAKDEYVAKLEALEAAMIELGVGTYVQCQNTLSVFKIVKPKGTFTFYRDIDYVRTAREGERGGSVLSKKEAEEAGFVLKKA